MNTEAIPWLWWSTVALFGVFLSTFAMMLFYGRLLRTLEAGWYKRASEVLYQRAVRHTAET
jgi:hypothetical protein